MALITLKKSFLCREIITKNIFAVPLFIDRKYSTNAEKGKKNDTENEEFRVLELIPKRQQRKVRKRVDFNPALPPRYKTQKIDQDWGNVWPTARTFHPAVVPLPIRQGYPDINKAAPDKWGNAELMKIPNFLHLSPPIIKRQCLAIKKFCTAWPAGLENEAQMTQHFPMTVITSTYLHSSPTVRDPRARIVTVKIPLKCLDLDYHAKDKLLRLVGERYDSETDTLTLVADRCPLSLQNKDYISYLLTVLYNESIKTEPWEHEKEFLDKEMYVWDGSPSQTEANKLRNLRGDKCTDSIIDEYKAAVEAIRNKGEDIMTLTEYENAVLKLIGLD